MSVIAFAVSLVTGLIAIRMKSWSGVANLALTAGLIWLLFVYSYLAYAFAYTVIGPAGIRGRSLTGRYEYRWEQIANVARRAFTSRGSTTYSVVLTTTEGDRLRLGAPVAGGVMGDPAFDAKYAQIRAAWQAATGRTGPEADTKSIWTRGVLLMTGGLTLQIVSLVVIVSLLSYYGPALAAHEGKGTTGVFTSEIRNCPQPTCTWFGTFTGGAIAKYATLAPGGPSIGHANVTVAAVDTGAKYTVYPVGGGTAWKAPLAGVVAASAALLVMLAAEIIAVATVRRRRRRRARAGLA